MSGIWSDGRRKSNTTGTFDGRFGPLVCRPPARFRPENVDSTFRNTKNVPRPAFGLRCRSRAGYLAAGETEPDPQPLFRIYKREPQTDGTCKGRNTTSADWRVCMKEREQLRTARGRKRADWRRLFRWWTSRRASRGRSSCCPMRFLSDSGG